MFGIDWDGPPVHDDEEDTVVVPVTPTPLLPEEFSLLQTLIDPSQPCDDFGIAMYTATREYVRDVLSHRIPISQPVL